LKEHYNWLYFYCKVNPLKPPITLTLRRIFTRNFFYLALVALPILFLISGNESIIYNDLMLKLTYWAFIPIVIALIVAIPALSYLGEAYRYVQYAVVPVAISSVLYIESAPAYAWLVPLACVLMSFLVLFKFKKHVLGSNYLVQSTDVSSYNLLKNYTSEYSLVFPHIRSLELNYFTGLGVIHLVRPKNIGTVEHFENLLSKYDIRFVINFDKNGSQILQKLKDVASVEKILTYTNFDVYKLERKTAENKENGNSKTTG
jgi:hypothetical protein